MRLLNVRVSIVSLLCWFIAFSTMAQEFNMTVQVNAQNIAQPDQTIFKTLETSMQEFINNTKWTEKNYDEEERINGALIFVVTNYDNNRFQGNFQLSVSRPVYNSTYTSTIFNYKDNDISFEYIENSPFFYNDNQFQSNLTSLVTFYVYTVLGIDGDTFALKGGQKYHEEAQQIVNLAQSSRNIGWNPGDGNGLISRYRLNNDLLSDTYKEYREIMYDYHINGMDKFALNPKEVKQNLQGYIMKFEELNSRRPNSLLQRTFFDAKADEITSIYTGGPAVNIAKFKETLQDLAPNQSTKWRSIKV
ncbi:type IX secretion system protein PorD [Nonlabens marinus]|uniref:DUF4835 domain-containing protein n=1 Tax=Nonlabens marinus S1-08 TaxID=1454201 RepID=W8VVZ4_9FLAO|nr:DUF4835 family protein [Nonlabens marinus]BAO55883.1 hypothetical protein NMS_1874 [Nonlabens marinus S1-08]